MALLAVFGISSDGLNLVVSLLLLFVVVFWLALIYWTFTDARRRIADPLLVGCATGASVFPFVGTIVYMIVRPPEYLEEVRERELEIAAAEVRLAAIENLACPHCHHEIERAFLRCPSCLRRLKEPCATCGKPLAPGWKLCPYCESEIGQAPPQPVRRERPAAAPAPADQRRAAAPGTQRQRQPTGGQRQPAQRQAAPGARRAPEGQRQPAPSTADGGRAPAAGQRRPRTGTPAADGQAKRPSSGSQRPAAGPKPARKGNREKRTSAPASERPVSQQDSDAVTTEQPAARPKTRPPSAR